MQFQRSRVTTTLVAVVVVLSTVLVSAPLVTATATVSLSTPDDTYHRGDLVPLVVTLDDASSATLTIDGLDGSYRSTVGVYDDGDGRVELLLDTSRAGGENETAAYATVDPDDRAVPATLVASSSPLPTGNYAVTAVTDESGADSTAAATTDATVEFDLEPFAYDSATVRTAPVWSDPDDFDGELTAQSTVATGDWVVLSFTADGLSGLLDENATLGETDLVVADPTTPGERSTHRVQVPVGTDGTLRSVVVDYSGSDDHPDPVSERTQPRSPRVGVDRDGDGLLDARFDAALTTVTVTSEGEYRFAFSGDAELAAGEVLVLEYDVVNPSSDGSQPVSVSVNDAPAEDGVVVYGPPGQGSLGNGVDLRLERVDDGATVTPLLSSAAYEFDPAANRLNVTTLAPATPSDDSSVTYRATLALTPQSPLTADARNDDDPLAATFTVVPRAATVDALEPTVDSGRDGDVLSVPADPVTVSGTSTLAQGSRIVVLVRGSGDGGPFMQAQFATVEADGSWTATLDFDGVDPGTEFALAVYEWDPTRPVPVSELTPEPVRGRVVGESA